MRSFLFSPACGLLLLASACGDTGRKSTTEPPLTLSDLSSEHLAGRRGNVQFEVHAAGDRGARATFRLAGGRTGGDSSATKGAAGDDASELEVVLHDETHAELRYAGTTLDGAGALSDDEAAALRKLVESALYTEIPLIGLDTPCATSEVIEPRLLAALLVPFQAVLKYLTPDLTRETETQAAASSCRYFSQLDAKPDLRTAPVLPLLANAQAVPMAFGYLPFDAEGELASAERSSELRTKQKPDVDVYGPGQSMCRGACGADCEPTNCGEPEQEWRCVQEGGRNTGDKERYTVYTCGEHEGCIEHDACFDSCNETHGVGSWDAAFCMRACDLQAASSYGALQGLEWARGKGPFTHEKSYEYASGERIRDEKMCPLNFGLTVTPNSGMAPLRAKVEWEFDVNESAAERCRLDLGDGSPPVTLDPCPARGTHEHTFKLPSEMYNKSGAYQVSLTRIGADQTATSDVQANWSFKATPSSGKAPLSTQLSWEGFSGVDRALTCTLNFGDGSEPEVIENCQRTSSTQHVYADVGAYTATLSVRGGGRTLTRAIVIEVRDEATEDCSILSQATRFSATATFSYAVSASYYSEHVQHQASATLTGTLVFKDEGGDGISYDVTDPNGNVMYSERTDLDGEFLLLEQGSGAPLGEGSQILLNINRRDCTFNIHVQASVSGTRKWADGPVEEADFWVSSFNSENIPFPKGLSASFSGNYPARSWVDDPELSAFYYFDDYRVVHALGEENLGSAQVSWQIALEE